MFGFIHISSAIAEENPTKLRYYGSFFNNYGPITRGDRKSEILISPGELNKVKNYYIEKIDNYGKVISFEKIQDRKCAFKVNYYYDSLRKLIKVVDSDCKKTLTTYNIDYDNKCAFYVHYHYNSLGKLIREDNNGCEKIHRYYYVDSK